MDRGDFAKFFAAVNGGHVPFRWQERLLDTVLGTAGGRTGSPPPPGQGRHRRSTSTSSPWHSPPAAGGPGYRAASRWWWTGGPSSMTSTAMPGPSPRPSPILAVTFSPEVAARLAALRWPGTSLAPEGSALVTGADPRRLGPVQGVARRTRSVRGAERTPDMWGSRLLFGGYGTSDQAAPWEAGLLAFDAPCWSTRRTWRVSCWSPPAGCLTWLVAPSSRWLVCPPLQVIEVSATPAPGRSARRRSRRSPLMRRIWRRSPRRPADPAQRGDPAAG